MSVVDFARLAHDQKCSHWRGPEYPGLAHPFGRPENMPDHHWRVSWDVMQALTEAAPPPVGDNPKTADGATKLLFGWEIDVDKDVPAGTLLLLVGRTPKASRAAADKLDEVIWVPGSAPMSRIKINEVRRLVADSDVPDKARRRQLHTLDEMEVAWVDEVYRRWHRRKYAPIRRMDRAISDLIAAVVAPVVASLSWRPRKGPD